MEETTQPVEEANTPNGKRRGRPRGSRDTVPRRAHYRYGARLPADPNKMVQGKGGVHDRRPAWHYRALTLFLTGTAPADIATEIGVSNNTIHAFLGNAWVNEQCALFYERFRDRATAQLVDPITKFQAKLDARIEELDRLCSSADEKVALAAIREWINHTIGSPVRRSEVDIRQSFEGVGVSELRFIAEHHRRPSPAELAAYEAAHLALPAPETVTVEVESLHAES